jgi:hypothetical protein
MTRTAPAGDIDMSPVSEDALSPLHLTADLTTETSIALLLPTPR